MVQVLTSFLMNSLCCSPQALFFPLCWFSIGGRPDVGLFYRSFAGGAVLSSERIRSHSLLLVLKFFGVEFPVRTPATFFVFDVPVFLCLAFFVPVGWLRVV